MTDSNFIIHLISAIVLFALLISMRHTRLHKS